MGKTTKVTFTKAIDHYAPGDVREVSADELKRLDEYATRWKIKDYYVKGEQTLEAQESPKPSKTTATVSSEGKTTPNRPRAAQAVEASGTDADEANDEQPSQESTVGNDNGGSDDAKAKEAAAAAGEGDAPDTTGEDSDTKGQGDSPEDATDEAQELPEASGEPVTDEGDKPKTATKANDKK
jgi:hypothetical protein